MNPKIFIFLGLFIILSFVGLAFLASALTNSDPNAIDLQNRYQSPSSQHWFGLDENGSDVFTKVAYGSRVSLVVAITVVAVSLFIGLILGSMAGGFGGRVDHIIMRLIDIVHAFPNILLALALVAAMGASLFHLILAMTLSSWAGCARLVRGEVLYLKQKDYVHSSKAIGASGVRSMVLHIWPNLFGVLSVQATFAMAATVISEAGLSFLGLGVPSTTPTWGALLNSGRKILSEAPHVSFFAGGSIFLLVLAFNLLGDGLRDYYDPKSKNS